MLFHIISLYYGGSKSNWSELIPAIISMGIADQIFLTPASTAGTVNHTRQVPSIVQDSRSTVFHQMSGFSCQAAPAASRAISGSGAIPLANIQSGLIATVV